ncbi:MAG: hypothetical protein H6623_09415 [Bdellovibrionaceae bacterium]|nr:hypothetical protein [Pseudobdellovibrionaceae bacterium]
MRFFDKTLYSLCIIIFAIGCSKKTEDSSTLPSVDPTTPGSGIGSPDETAGFNVSVVPPSTANYFIHKDGDFSADCAVDPDATAYADRDISCIIEVEELEGRFHGIDMKLNVPTGSCSYATYYPYFYYGLEHGTGPTAVSLTYDADNVLTGSSVTGPGYVTSDGTPMCDYDHSPADGPNCCYGTYTLTKTVDVNPPTVETDIDWGGTPGNCVQGAGKTAERTKVYGLPVTTIYDTAIGLSVEHTVGDSLLLPDSLLFANYFSGATPTAFQAASTFPGNPYYEFACYDTAHELKRRIRVMVREWNEESEFELEAAGDPDTTGVEADWGTPINDYEDWKDIVDGGDGFPGFYD